MSEETVGKPHWGRVEYTKAREGGCAWFSAALYHPHSEPDHLCKHRSGLRHRTKREAREALLAEIPDAHLTGYLLTRSTTIEG